MEKIQLVNNAEKSAWKFLDSWDKDWEMSVQVVSGRNEDQGGLFVSVRPSSDESLVQICKGLFPYGFQRSGQVARFEINN